LKQNVKLNRSKRVILNVINKNSITQAYHT
jgi:hypothetical protein